MKNIKKIVFALLIALILPIVNVSAKVVLTIDDKAYNENTQIFTVSGYSPYEDVMVTLFDGDELLSFKTVQSENYQYGATFKIAFDEDKTITIKVGDINSTEYEISTLEVKKSVTPERSNKLTDEAGNSLTILDKTKKFELDDRLEIEVKTDLSEFNQNETALLDSLQEKLGSKKQIVGVMIISVLNGENNVDLDEVKNGYELFLNLRQDDLSPFTKPYMARVLVGNEIRLEAGKALVYSSDANGVVTKLNNIGAYILYDDTTINYKFLDNTDNQKYDLFKGETITFKIDADLNKFVNIYIGGKLIDPKYYTKESGSTVITLSKDYLQTLAVGKYNVKADFTDGEATTTLTVINTNPSNPKTSDNIVTYVVIGSLSLVVLIGVSAYVIKRKKNA